MLCLMLQLHAVFSYLNLMVLPQWRWVSVTLAQSTDYLCCHLQQMRRALEGSRRLGMIAAHPVLGFRVC